MIGDKEMKPDFDWRSLPTAVLRGTHRPNHAPAMHYLMHAHVRGCKARILFSVLVFSSGAQKPQSGPASLQRHILHVYGFSF
jgi:hypothetical protein